MPTNVVPSILVAEDDLATRALLRATLEPADYRVRDVDRGAAALAEIKRCPPDVALLANRGAIRVQTRARRHAIR